MSNPKVSWKDIGTRRVSKECVQIRDRTSGGNSGKKEKLLSVGANILSLMIA